MKRTRKPSVISILFPIVLVSLVMTIIACEWTITVSSRELQTRALETSQAEIDYMSDALYSQLTAIQLQNVEILNSDSVLALAMRSTILDRYEIVSYENTVMKQIRARLSQLNLIASAQLYLPTIRTMITAQKAAAATEAELEEMFRIIREFPGGLYYTGEVVGFWSASPLIYDVSQAEKSRVMFTAIRRDSVRSLLQKYTSHSENYQLLLMLGGHVLASSHDLAWDESLLQDAEGNVHTVSILGSPYYVIRADHASSGLSICGVLRVDDVMRNIYRQRRWLRILEIICVLIVLLSTLPFYRVIIRPLKGMADKMRQVGDGDLGVRMLPEKTAELNDVASTFNDMAGRLQNLIDREYTSRLLAANAEKKALQYQITPHFLYNTYFQLRNLILLEENEQAQRLADLMGRYLRYIVHADGTSALLGEEMDHARNYADIQSLRFKGRIEVLWEVPEGDWRKMEVPRLLVQPLIENAFGHGLKNVEQGGTVRVALRESDTEVAISVEDNGTGLSDSDLDALRRAVTDGAEGTGENVALTNIQRRVHLHFGDPSGLVLERSEIGGLKVTIRMEKGKGDRNHGKDSAGGR